MIISIINHSNGKVSDAELQTVIRAINRQIKEDFEPYWSLSATVRLEGRSSKNPDTQRAIDMRGDAVIYLWDKADVEDAIGYHDLNNRGIPFGFVFLDIARQLGEAWSVTLSHEVMELIGDPEVNLLVAGPHPNPKVKRTVFHWYEMCDAVQSERYKIDGIEVSNFLLPLYFTSTDEFAGRNDFMGTVNKDGSTLKSFGVNPGGYSGFFDPKLDDNDNFTLDDDKVAQKRLAIKRKIEGTRRSIRYQRHSSDKSEPGMRFTQQDQKEPGFTKGKRKK
ncbi:hypothetical protein [Chryseolinea soli]|nr:hypothetical protein [Chryseolinea soli]